MAVARARSWCATPAVAGPVVVEAGTGGADHRRGRGSWEAQGTLGGRKVK